MNQKRNALDQWVCMECAVVSEKAKNFKGTIKKLFKYLKPYYFKLFVVIIFAVVQRSLQLLDQRFWLKQQINYLKELWLKLVNTGGIDFEYIGYIIWILVGLYLVSALFSYIQGFITSTISQHVAYDLRTSII